ncbi:hypothetical protein LCGC14_2532240 [marine sediment metagenome]|uniref:Uncharacterized protein n=1 Tax=marine sediment metagenome TaxID=412755 RepID=A0A0F9AT76_9ZZZZ
MTKIKVYIRIAKTSRGYKIITTDKPSYKPLSNVAWRGPTYYPTVAFAVVFNLPDDAFKKATEVIDEINVEMEKLSIATEVETIKSDEENG